MEFFGNDGKNFIEIFGLTITMYAFCIVLGATIAAFMAVKEGQKLGLKKDFVLDGILFGIPLGLVGARLFYVIFEWDRYHVQGDFFQTLLNIVKISEGGLGITGGIIAAILFIIVYCKKKNTSILKVMDIVAPGLLVGQVFGRWGNFFNQEAHGGIIKDVEFMYKILPDFIMDRMLIGGYYYHPTFLYESLWNLVGLIIILIARNKVKKIQIGDFVGFYLAWYGFCRAVLIEPFRTDPLMMGDIRINVVIPALMCIGGIVYLVVKHLKFPQPSYVLEKEFIKENGIIEEENNEPVEKISFKERFINKIKSILELDEKEEEYIYDENVNYSDDSSDGDAE